MREFKFRQWTTGWASGEKRMVYLGDIRNPDFSILQVGELMQYTGLKDIHGKEVYEGDVLACINYTNVIENVVYSDEKGGYWSSDDMLLSEMMADDEYDFEIIGNIYENPELN